MDLPEIGTRLGMAFATGFILGLERESHGRAAGLRTTALVCLAAAMAGVLSDQMYSNSFEGAYKSGNWHPDPARLGAGLLTGIGFLGAGAIIRQGNVVRGVTTASLIWFTTIIGLCYGTGHILLGLIGLLLSVTIVFFLRVVESRIKKDWYAMLTITTTNNGISIKDLQHILNTARIVIKNIEFAQDVEQNTKTFHCSLRFKRSELIELPERICSELAKIPGVRHVDWK